jgi:outer membrane lipoprotein-sorting protein
LTPLFKRPLVVSLQPLKFFILAMVGFGLAGCATVSPPEPQLPAPKWEAAELIKSIAQRREQFRSVRALAQVDYAGPDGRYSFQEAVVVQRPDRLRLETLSYLGAILIVTVNDKEIVGYHPREGVFVRGRRSKENLLRYTKIPLELDEMTSLLVGLPPVEPSAPWKQEGNTLIFSQDGHKKDALAFESQQPVPTKWERFNASGAVELSVRFSDYVSTPAGLFPSKISIEAPLQKKKLEIRYQEPELNSKIPSDLFTQQKPPHAQEVPIEAIGS